MSVSDHADAAPLRIGFVTLQYPPLDVGGIGSYVQTIATELARAGHDVTVVCAARDQTRSTTTEQGVLVERFPMLGPERLWRRFVRPEQSQRVRIHHALTSAWALWRTRRRFDVIEVPEWKAQPLLLRGALVVHLHLTLEIQHAWIGVASSRKLRLSYALERLGVRRATRVTATSRQTTQLPDGSAWMDSDDVDIVSPPFAFGGQEAPCDIDATEPVVLFVGRLERRKAPELLLEALALLQDEVPDARAVFVGRPMEIDGRPYDAHLRELAGRLGVPCDLRGQVDDPEVMRRLYRQARVVAIPSRFETLSMVAFEALANGRPVVLSDAVGAAEWIPDLVECIVPTDDARALADALRPHLRSASHAKSVAKRGRAQLAKACSTTEMVESRVRVYRSARAEASSG